MRNIILYNSFYFSFLCRLDSFFLFANKNKVKNFDIFVVLGQKLTKENGTKFKFFYLDVKQKD